MTRDEARAIIAAYDAVLAERDEARREVAQVVAWLNQPAWSRQTLDRRIIFAIKWLFDPAVVYGAVARHIARAIEAGAHKGGDDVAED
jgi:hypothetical protein